MNKHIKLFFILLVSTFALFLVLNITQAGTDRIPITVDYCARHGYRDTKTCDYPDVVFTKNYYWTSAASFQILGHRHGYSAIETYICVVPSTTTGVCSNFFCEGPDCGPEYGDEDPFPLLPNRPGPNSGTIRKDVAFPPGSGFVVSRWAFVEDAEVKISWDAGATYVSPVITGRVYDRITDKGFGGVVVSTCIPSTVGPTSVTTDINGNFSFPREYPRGFCVRVTPQSQSGYTGPVLVDRTATSYEEQRAGIHDDSAGDDRPVDTGYDFVYTKIGTPAPGTPTPTPTRTPTPTPTPTPTGGSVVLYGSTTATTFTDPSWQDPFVGTELVTSDIFDFKAVVSGLTGTLTYKYFCNDTDPLPKVSTTSNVRYNTGCRYPSLGTYTARVDVHNSLGTKVASDKLTITLTNAYIYGNIIDDKNGDKTIDAEDQYILEVGSPDCGTRFKKLSGFSMTYSGPVSGTVKPDICNSGYPRFQTPYLPAGTYTLTYTFPSTWDRVFPATNPITVNITTTPSNRPLFVTRTLTVGIDAIPDTDVEVLNTSIIATVTSLAPETLNYSIWWDCDNPTTSVSVASTACGALPAPGVGLCLGNANGYKCNSVSDLSVTVSKEYRGAKDYIAKVIIEQSDIPWVQAQKTIKVIANQPPVVTSATVEPFLSYCGVGAGFNVNWVYSGPEEGDDQSASRVQVSKFSTFTPLIYDQVASSSSSIRSITGLEWGKDYYVRVKVWDSYDLESIAYKTATPSPFKTPLHAYPQVNFDWVPRKPSPNEEIQFTDKSVIGTPTATYDWSWSKCKIKGKPTCLHEDSPLKNPTNQFTNETTYFTKLSVTDDDGYKCTVTKDTRIGNPRAPGWKEVAPQ